ncbi:MAG TPA: hypothetical protein VFM64_00990 [Candidatus Nitrosotenuis sp.]|nr:hypothetical protein [Candidatus Nitrosotenuis sp.]
MRTKYALILASVVAVGVSMFALSLQATNPNPEHAGQTMSVPKPIGLHLSDYGTVIPESKVAYYASVQTGKFDNPSLVPGLNGDNLLQIRARDNGYVYYFYGPRNLSISDDLSLVGFIEKGGIVVETIVMNNPAAVYKSLDRNSNSYLEINGMDAISHQRQGDSDIVPTYVKIYPGDERRITIMSDGSLDNLVEIAKNLNIEPGALDLEKYPEIPYSPEPILTKP